MILKEPLFPNRTIFETTLRLNYNNSKGTCFIINHKSSQYLVTERHIFQDVNNDTEVIISVEGAFINKTLTARILFHDIEGVDVAILEIEKLYRGEVLKLNPSSDFLIGQESIFLGFPLYEFLFSSTSIGKTALVKKAIVSGRLLEDNLIRILLDGHNNPGFSGGPIVSHNGRVNEQFIIGVVSGYYNQKNIDKFIIDDKEIEIITNANSGIIITYPCEYIIDILNKK
jgi:S1-C subfamily serine protease